MSKLSDIKFILDSEGDTHLMKSNPNSDITVRHLPANEMPLSKFVQLYGNILFDNQESDEEKDKKLDELYNNLENFMDKVK